MQCYRAFLNWSLGERELNQRHTHGVSDSRLAYRDHLPVLKTLSFLNNKPSFVEASDPRFTRSDTNSADGHGEFSIYDSESDANVSQHGNLPAVLFDLASLHNYISDDVPWHPFADRRDRAESSSNERGADTIDPELWHEIFAVVAKRDHRKCVLTAPPQEEKGHLFTFATHYRGEALPITYTYWYIITHSTNC